MLAPLLLLLSQDPVLLPSLTQARRYCPPAAAVCVYLSLLGIAMAGSTAKRMATLPEKQEQALGLEVLQGVEVPHALLPLLPSAGRPGLAALLEAGLVTLTVPSQLLLLAYLWTPKV
jgi:hypothetical protein